MKFFEINFLLPVFIITKAPVPYVLFTDPFLKQAWPNAAACWSPKTAEIGIFSPITFLLVLPKSSAEFFTIGKIFLYSKIHPK